MTELLIVTGMHRSGTSLVAGLLRALGVDVGPEDELMPAKEDNPRGFVEHLPAVRVNDRVLYRRGGSWKQPPALPPGWVDDPGLDELREEARDVAERLRGRGAPVALLKDPRFSLTLPFWRSVTQVDRVVDVVRQPSSVVASLLRRDDELDADGAASLWMHYVLSALRNAPDAPVVVPGDLLADPDAGVRALASAAGLEPDPDATERALGQIERTLWGRSERELEDGPTAPTLELAVHLFAALSGPDATLWRGVLGNLAPVVSATPTGDPQAAKAANDRITQLHERLAAMTQQRDAAHERATRLRAELDQAQQVIQRLQGKSTGG